MIKDMTIEEIRAEYDKLLPITTMPGERTWVNRLTSWEDFLKMGQKVADLFHNAYAYANGNEHELALYEEEIRGLNPELHDLVLKVFIKQ